MAVSRPCENGCSKKQYKECSMYLDETTKKPVYLCRSCAKELGYLVKEA